MGSMESKTNNPPLLCNGKQNFRSSEKAEELARQFERSQNLTLHMCTPHHSQVVTRAVNKVFSPLTPSTLTIKPTNPSEVRRRIRSLKSRTAPGNYRISTVMLRHLSTRAIQHLTLIFNSILQSGKQPKSFQYINQINPPQTLTPTAPSASLAQSVNF